jgi:hypothetical protein
VARLEIEAGLKVTRHWPQALKSAIPAFAGCLQWSRGATPYCAAAKIGTSLSAPGEVAAEGRGCLSRSDSIRKRIRALNAIRLQGLNERDLRQRLHMFET